MKRILALSALAVLLQACSSSPTASGDPATMPARSSTAAAQPATLTTHTWRLAAAVDRQGQPIAPLQIGLERPLRLAFSERAINISGGCNAQFGGYTYGKGRLEIANLAATMKACEAGLMALDAAVGERLKGSLRATLGEQAGQPRLVLVADNGDTLSFDGEPTPETLYGSKGETVFLEVAAQRVQCSHPMIPQHRCLQVRERRYDAAGLQLPAQDDWHPLYQSVQGYEHRDGVRTVLRTKRYEWKNPPADAPSTVYVLDMVVEQEMAPGGKR
ncbi:PF14302 domain protein [Bordetella bronchiseptica 980-2]|nr:PF14302 domain protein [Bordetella bronchiseptica 980-2]KCV57835.1 PF14302 domain protein [Bordetella bronchiseptica 980]KDB62338.1 PF14302 domain protein [Bordetella bronchiseptica B18-5 (C3)]KDB85812.1 PF14302 domain protein [Bordetella bronchiseptica D756]KDB92118.1 PF14302 domain protein [Bordetella bronchiseptica D989]KDB95527.1 PF14302 domain protein [Bordetella bronchiseptica E010]KDB99524.1 PF14302 domain protein [Bordetella bronchiseptica D993]KDC09285.1 PF14302 domain protein [B